MKYTFSYCIVGLSIFFAVVLLSFTYIPSHTYFYLVHTPAMGSVLSLITKQDRNEARYQQAQYFFSDPVDRDINKTIELLNSTDDFSQEKMLLLARAYFAQGDVDSVLRVADQYLISHTENSRMHYIRGLAHGYAGNWDQAEDDFKRFIAYAPDEWAGYLDLSWVYFQTGRMADARSIIERGYVLFPDNPWITMSFGVVMYNQAQTEQANFLLREAQKQAKDLSFQEWRTAYSANSEQEARESFQEFSKVIEFNLAIIENKDQALDFELIREVMKADFADESLRGLRFGLHVSACNSSCPACNVCGECNTHTDHGADTPGSSCAPPALPSGYGSQCVSANNVCAQNNVGTIGCAGCSATVPETPVPNADGFRYVPHNEQIYIYEEASFPASEVSDTCYSFVNTSGSGVFVPLRSVQEFEAFIGASVIDESSRLELEAL